MFKRIVFIILALLIVVGIVAGIKFLQIRTLIKQGGGFVPPPAVVTGTAAEKQVWETTFQATGSLEAVQGVMVAAELPGKVTEISFKSGEMVKAGDLLVQLNIETEKAQLQAAEASASLAKAELDRISEVLADNGVSKSEYDKASAAYKEAAAQVEAIQSAIAKKTIRAPFDGRLGIRLVNLGQILGDGDAIVSLQRLDPIYVNFQLPQHYLSRVKNGYQVRLTSDVMPDKTMTGTITTIDSEIESNTRSFRVQATVPNSEEFLHPGMYVDVAVVLPAKKDVLAIPSTAVLYAPYSDSVFIIAESEAGKDGQNEKKGKVLRQQFVRLGERRGDFVEVTSGLAEGDMVASTGVFKLRNGQSAVIDNTLNPEFKLQPQPANQ
jgi:membrane fusion protein (multidrug efflux system)